MSDEVNIPLLSICILTYNRGPQVDALLMYLRASILPVAGDLIDLLVVNNCSTDNTEQLLKRHEVSGIRIIKREVFLPTAEENMMRSVEYCRGKYLWFLGDDDYPITDCVFDLIEHLKTGSVDILVANSINVEEGRNLTEHLINMNVPYLKVPLEGFIAATGLLAVLAGMSRLVFLRDRVSTQEGLEFLVIQPIYAHVVWLLKSFRSSEISVFNRPLVRYTTLTASSDKSRFVRFQLSERKGTYTYWSFGLVSLLEILIREKVLTTETFSRAFDVHNDGGSCLFLDFLTHMGFFQIMTYIKCGIGREEVLQEDLSRFSNFILSCDPAYFPVLQVLDRLLDIAKSPSNKLARLYQARKVAKDFYSKFSPISNNSDRLHRVLYRGMVFGFSVYHGATKWIAVRSDVLAVSDLSLGRILLCLDPVEDFPKILIAESRKELEERITSYVTEKMKIGEVEILGDEALAIKYFTKKFERFIDISGAYVEHSRQSMIVSRAIFKMVSLLKKCFRNISGQTRKIVSFFRL